MFLWTMTFPLHFLSRPYLDLDLRLFSEGFFHIARYGIFPLFGLRGLHSLECSSCVSDYQIIYQCISIISACYFVQLMRALKDLPSLEKMEYEQDIYGVTYGIVVC